MPDKKTMELNSNYYVLHHLIDDFTEGYDVKPSLVMNILRKNVADPNEFSVRTNLLRALHEGLKANGTFNSKYEPMFQGDNKYLAKALGARVGEHRADYKKIVRAGRSIETLQYASGYDLRPSVANYVRMATSGLPNHELLFGFNVNVPDVVKNKVVPKLVVDPTHVLYNQDNFNRYTEGKQVLATPFMLTPKEFQRTNADKYKNLSSVYSERVKTITDMGLRNRLEYYFGDTPLMREPDDDGKQKPLDGFDQISTILGDYVSDTDLKSLKTAIPDGHRYSPYAMKQSKAVLKKLYDSGADFTLDPVINKDNGEISIRANIASSNANRMQVRVLEEPGQEDYIGRLYDGHGAYYVNLSSTGIVRKSGYSLYTDEDFATAPLDYLTRAKDGTVMLDVNHSGFTSGDKARVQNVSLKHPMDAGNREMNALPISYRDYDTHKDLDMIHPDTEESANIQLQNLISTARNQFIRKTIGDDLTNVDNVMSGYQQELYSFMKDNNIDNQVLHDLDDMPMATSLKVTPKFMDAHELTDESAEPYRLLVEKVNALTDEGVGTFSDGFHPSNVSNLVSEISNSHAQEQIIACLMKGKYDVSKLKHDETTARFSEAMIKYKGKDNHVTTLHDTEMSPNPLETTETNDFKRDMMQLTADTLVNAGIVGTMYDVNSKKEVPQAGAQPKITMDSQGIIHWEGYRSFGNRATRTKAANLSYQKVTGNIGQVFAPDENGIAHIELNGNEAYDYVPGISGYYKYDGLEEGKNRMERLRGEGYEQLMRREIFNALNVQIMRPYRGVEDTSYTSDFTSLNKIYHGESYGTRLDKGWFDSPETDTAIGLDVKKAIVKNLQNRVHFPNKLRDNATTFSESGENSVNTKVNGVSQLVDAKNLRVLDSDYINTFDMTMTGTNKTQGMVLYLDKGAKLNTDGTITPSDDDYKDPTLSKAPIRGLDYFKYQKYNAWDRNQMASNQILTANGIDKSRTALMTMGGWTYDDSAVVSKEFAERNMVKGHDGEYRPLMKGDKLSDFGGNKATIGLIVDRNMDIDEAKAQGIDKEVMIFNQNPDLDTVMSPYSVITRDNTGVVHELMDNNPKPVMFTDPETGKAERIGDSGELNLIITDMLADSKTHAYSEEDIADGKGRKLSSQYTWALNQHGADKIIQTAFNKNERQWAAYREYLLVAGYDLDADGTLKKAIETDKDVVKTSLDLHDGEYRKHFTPSADVESDEFIRQLGSDGGLMELPTTVKLPSGVQTDTLPIMSASLRYNTEFMDGSTKVNDYTKNYASIYDSVLKYNRIDDAIKDGSFTSKKYTPEQALQNAKGVLQRQVNGLTDSVVNDKLGGYFGESSKHSFMRDHLMSMRMEHSATAIATVDPRLSVNELSISQDVASSLDVVDGDYALVNRDPCLHAGSIRAMKVKVDESLQGIAMNPVSDKSFDGDFDGDTYGLITMPEFKTDPEIKKELEKMDIKNNLLDPGAPEPTSYLNVSMDVVSGSIKSGDTEYDGSETENLPASQLDAKLARIAEQNDPDVALAETNKIIKNSLNVHNYGAARVDLSSRDDMKKSIEDITNTGAKGSPKKVQEYMKYFDGMPFSEKLEADNDIQLASGYKSDLTGVAGSYSQRLMALTRDIDPEVALEVTYKASQGTLQIKHDPDQAKVVKEVLTNDLNNLFNGQHVDNSNDSKLSKSQFVNEFADVYQNKLGVDVSVDQLSALSETLADGGQTIKPMKDLVKTKASPIDQIAYGGGLSAIGDLADKHANIASGRHSSLIVPESIKTEGGKDKLIKHDVVDETALEDDDAVAIAEAINSIGDSLYNKVEHDGVVVKNNFAPHRDVESTEDAKETNSKPKSIDEKKKLLDDAGIDL